MQIEINLLFAGVALICLEYVTSVPGMIQRLQM